MRRFIPLQFFILSICLISCKKQVPATDNAGVIEKPENAIEIKTYIDTLQIEGDNIWVRSQPSNGEVVFSLDDKSMCFVLEKGKEETIRGNKDFWYKIEFEDHTGWVFGSQTSIKQIKSEDFKSFLSAFIDSVSSIDRGDVDLSGFVSPIQGLEYVKHGYIEGEESQIIPYTRESEIDLLFRDLMHAGISFYNIQSYQDSSIWQNATSGKAQLKLPMLMEGVTPLFMSALDFRQVEGKWYLSAIHEYGNFMDVEKSVSATQAFLYIDNFIADCYRNSQENGYDELYLPQDYIHEDIGIFRFYNPGVACVLYDIKEHPLPSMPSVSNPSYFYGQEPIDGFCVESPSRDGVYFSRIKDFPTYVDMETAEYSALDIPKKYHQAPKMKVKVLQEEWVMAELIFVLADNRWWLVHINSCDCSA